MPSSGAISGSHPSTSLRRVLWGFRPRPPRGPSTYFFHVDAPDPIAFLSEKRDEMVTDKSPSTGDENSSHLVLQSVGEKRREDRSRASHARYDAHHAGTPTRGLGEITFQKSPCGSPQQKTVPAIRKGDVAPVAC